MATADGKLIIPAITITVWGVKIRVEGSIELLDIRRRIQ
jgi:hypothetical protein